jgi:AcrR family transcriptional regulator
MARRASSAPSRAGGAIDRRQSLLDAGTEILTSKRLSDVSVDEIADRAGVAHGLLFHYFGSKEQFQVEVIRSLYARKAARFLANTEPDPARWLRRDLEIVVSGLEARPRFALLVGSNDPNASPKLYELVRGLQAMLVDRYAVRLEAAPASAVLRLALIGYMAATMAVVATWLDTGQPERSELIAMLVDTFVATIQTASRHDPSLTIDPQVFR